MPYEYISNHICIIHEIRLSSSVFVPENMPIEYADEYNGTRNVILYACARWYVHVNQQWYRTNTIPVLLFCDKGVNQIIMRPQNAFKLTPNEPNQNNFKEGPQALT